MKRAIEFNTDAGPIQSGSDNSEIVIKLIKKINV
jgi:hypothetical protein